MDYRCTHTVYHRKAWIALGDMTKVDSQLEIIKLLETADSQMKETVLERWRVKQSKEEKDKSRYIYNSTEICVWGGVPSPEVDSPPKNFSVYVHRE